VRAALPALALLLVALVAVRDLPDYYTVWPQRGLVRFLFHANMADAAAWAAASGAADAGDFAISGTLLGPWEREALRLELAARGVENAAPRWYDESRAAFLRLGPGGGYVLYGYPSDSRLFADRLPPAQGQVGDYLVGRLPVLEEAAVEPLACFANGLCLLNAAEDPARGTVDLFWSVGPVLKLPQAPLISKPAPPGVYDGPRLLVFAQLLDGGGAFLNGDDGLWVDPATLHPGDRFVQRHLVGQPAGAQTLAVGLYDPLTGARILTDVGRDAVQLPWAP
jgi:hypothetical protein